MGMPIITPGTGTRNQSVTDLIQSVALQETALSHILNAEGEKMQSVIANPQANLQRLMELNRSVNQLINTISRLEVVFHGKLELFSNKTFQDATPTEPNSTAAEELAKIDVSSVSINVPLDDPAAQQAAVEQAIAAAQAQVGQGYTVTYTPADYTTDGTLTGSFTVTNDSNPADIAIDTASPAIAVTYSAVPNTTAVEELAKINVSSVSIAVPLDDPAAQQAAVEQAIADAQAQVGKGYTVTFTPSGYTTDGTLTGFFKVTNDSNPADSEESAVEQTIHVTSTAEAAVASASSSASAQFLSGTLLDGDLSAIVGINGAAAEYVNGDTSGTEVSDSAKLDLDALGMSIIDINGISFPIGYVLQLGAVNQYAQASQNGASRAFSGAVSNDGIVSVGGSADYPANMTLDLMRVLPQTDILSQANLSFGAISGAAQWDASLGSNLAPDTDITNPSQGRAYHIAEAEINLNSPSIGDVVDTLHTAVEDMGNAVDGISDAIINGSLSGVTSSLNLLSGIVPLVTVGKNNLTANVDIELQSLLDPILSQPIVSADGVLSVNLSTGAVDVNLGMLNGGTLNHLSPNTSLLTPEVIDRIVKDLEEILSFLQEQLNTILQQPLNDTTIQVSGHVILLETFGLESAGLDLNYNGTLNDLITGAQAMSVDGTGLLASALTPVIGGLTSALQSAIAAAVNPLLSNILYEAGTAIENSVTSLASLINPLFALVQNAISVHINVQQDNVDGANTFTEIPVQISLLNDGVTLNLAKVVVGENTYTSM